MIRLPDHGQLFYRAVTDWLMERGVSECRLDPDTYLVDDLDFDAIDLAEFMLHFDDQFGFERKSPEAEALTPITIMDLVEYCCINSQFNKCVPDPARGAGYRKATAWEIA